jgi:hypothetical protein
MARWFVFAGIAGLVSACGGPSEERVPVYRTTGKITFEDKPLIGATVLFQKTEGDSKVPNPLATTTEDGSFTLHTYEPDDGAPAGDYLISVTIRPPNRDSGSGYSKKKFEAPPEILQGRYADPKTSGLKATIKTGENTLEPFNLTAAGGALPTVPPRAADR